MTPDEVKTAYQAHTNPFAAEAMAQLGAAVAVGARGATIRLADGREVLDLASGGFGYGHPKVLEKVQQQIRKMPLSSRVFYSVPLARLAQRLAHLTPGDLEVSFFGNAGAEAVEGALKLVKGYHRQRTRVVAAVGAYHGATTGALAVSGIEALRGAVGTPGRRPVDCELVPFGDAAALTRAVDERTAALILQPILTGNGVQVPPRGYLAAARARCSGVGALLVLDEITTGLGRTGRRWGADHDGVAPDIMVLAGALGGGLLPIGCYVATKAVNDKVYDKQDPLLHANTTGGNPSACTAALAALEVVEEEGLAERAAAAGGRIERVLRELAGRFDGLVRGATAKGLLAGLALADAQTARAVQKEALSRGALVRLDGLAAGEAWIGLRPPLITSELELERGLEILAAAVEAVAEPQATKRAVRS